MPCEVITRELKNSEGKGILFATRQLAATKQLELYVELMGKMGTSVFPLIDNKFNFGDLIQIMRANESPVIAELIKRIVCLSVVEGNEVKPHNYDLTFNGELMLSIRVFAFVLEANFQAFFKEGLAINEQRRLEEEARLAAEEQKSSSPKT